MTFYTYISRSGLHFTTPQYFPSNVTEFPLPWSLYNHQISHSTQETVSALIALIFYFISLGKTWRIDMGVRSSLQAQKIQLCRRMCPSVPQERKKETGEMHKMAAVCSVLKYLFAHIKGVYHFKVLVDGIVQHMTHLIDKTGLFFFFFCRETMKDKEQTTVMKPDGNK